VSAPSTLALSSTRFRILRKLGEGGMGVVYEVYDEERRARVALKAVRTLSADALARFKREFRAVADVHHPNLVSLDELISEGSQWFVTMELLEGVGFLEYVRPGAFSASGAESAPSLGYGSTQRIPVAAAAAAGVLPPLPSFDDACLRDALVQLVSGLEALHKAGLVHRDVKPSNVRVTHDGRLVVLDFGLVVESAGVDSSDHIAGTPVYMAPEQAAAKPVGPSADWYAVGVMLYEALTGTVPFAGNLLQILVEKQRGDVAPPSARGFSVPDDLDRLCAALLRFEPHARPDAQRILQHLGGVKDVAARLRTQSKTAMVPFVGREPELGGLATAYADSRAGVPVAVVVRGESGVGKSLLARHFVEELAARTPDVVVLAGRCYEREDVPYKALDGVVDALSRFLAKLPDVEVAAFVPRRAAALAQVFPVLRRVRAFAGAAREAQPDLAPQELRRRAFAALRELLARLGDRRSLVVLIDDLQWADADSLALLAELLGPPEPPTLLLVATARADDPEALAALDRALPRDARHVNLERLSPDDARVLAQRLASTTIGDDDARAAAIAEEAHGHPLFIDALVRYCALTGAAAPASLRLEDALWERFTQLEDAPRRVLELVVVAGAPIPQETVARAAGVELGALGKITSLLRVANLARTSGVRAADTVEPYHDRVREAVLARLEPEQVRVDHEHLALALEATPNADVQALSAHWAGAGKPAAAAQHAFVAAEQATRALAFDRAAGWYQRCLELTPASDPRRQGLFISIGEALANAGRCAAAATTFKVAAETAVDADAMDLRRRAADQLLRAGQIEEGLDLMRVVLTSVGMRIDLSAFRAALTFLVGSLFLRVRGVRFRERDPSTIAASELKKIDVCWSFAIGMGFANNLLAAAFHIRHLYLALRAGDPYRVALGLSIHAVFAARPGARSWPRAEPYLKLAGELAKKTGDAFAIGHVAFSEGMASVFAGRFRQGLESSDRAQDIWREHSTGAGWDLSTAELYSLTSLALLGELADLRRRHPVYLRSALDRGDVQAARNLRLGHPSLAWLVNDQAEEGRAEILSAASTLPKVGFRVEHYFAWYGLTNVELYAGRFAEAWALAEDRWPVYRRSMLPRLEIIRLHTTHARLRAALALAHADAGRRTELLGSVADGVHQIRKENVPWAKALAELSEAGLASVRGERERAAPLLAAAVEGFEAASMKGYAAAARRALGTMRGGDEGEALVRAADEHLARESVKDPLRFAATFAPGFWKY
jgi:hypothetical protein